MRVRFRVVPTLLLMLSGSRLAGCASWAPTDDPAPIVRGPLTTRHQQPMALTLMAFRPRRAATQPQGELAWGVQGAWSDIEEIQRNPSWSPTESVAFDGETVRVTVRGRYGVGERTDLEIELPFLYAFGGNLDKIIEKYHALLGLPDGSREEYPDDQYEMRVESGGDVLYDLEGNRLGVGDVPIFLTVAVREEDRRGPGIALRGGVELPTGSESRGFGNGAVDFGFGAIGERTWGRWTVSGGTDLVFPGQSDRLEAADAKHRYQNMYSFKLGGEFRWNDHLSVIAATVWTSRMIHSLALEEITSEVFDVGAGFVWDVGANSHLAISFHEDIVAATGADLTLQVGWTWNY